MTTAWYYDYYEKGAFPHQKQLCDAVRGTQCNLDGQLQVSAMHFTGVPTNALTLRLRTLQDVLHRLEEEINHINAQIKESTNDQFNKGNHLPGNVRLHTQDSQLETGGAAIEEISLSENQPIVFRYDTVHFALYDFFTNLGSILDRLAYETNLLYVLGDWVKDRLDWLRLTNLGARFLNDLSCKDKNLAKFIQDQTANFEKLPDYRNRLIHDSIISTAIEKVGFPFKFHVFLPRNPRDAGSVMDLNAIEYCKKAKADVLKLLDQSYKLMLQNLQTHGKPPW